MVKKDKFNNIVRIFLLLLGIVSHIWYLSKHSQVNPDEAYSLAQAHSYLRGEGLTIQAAKPQDISDIIISYSPRIPPGLALIMALLIKIFNSPGAADFLLEVAATLIFFICWFWIIRKHYQMINPVGEVFIWLLWIFFPSPLMAGMLTSHTTETLSVSLFMASLVLGATLIAKTNKLHNILLGTLVGIFSGLAAALRYMYWPMLAILPGTMLLYSLAKKRLKLHFGAIIACVMVSSLFLAGMMFLNLKATGHFVGYSTDLFGEVKPRLDNAQSMHWDHLNHTIPFPLFALGISDPAFMVTRTIIEIPPTLPNIAWVSWLASGSVLTGFLFYTYKTVRYLLLPERPRNHSLAHLAEEVQFIALAGLITFTLITATLGYLSISREMEKFGGGWVPVMELRYYSPIFIFFTLGLGYIISQTGNQDRMINGFAHLMNLILIGSILIVGIWRLQIGIRELESPNLSFSSTERFDRGTLLMTMLEPMIISPYPVIVVYSEHDTTIRRMAFNKGFVVAPLEAIPPSPALSTSHTVNAIIIYRDSEPDEVKSFFAVLVREQNGSCISRGSFTGCHILFTP